MQQRVKFNTEGFALALDAVRGSKGMNWKQVAQESGVLPSTISRIITGKKPDVDSLARLVLWCGIDFRRLIDSGKA